MNSLLRKPIFYGKPDAGNLHVRFDEGEGCRRSLALSLSIRGTLSTLPAGYAHTVGLKMDGTLFVWGFNNYGQLGDGTTVNRTTPVQIDPFITFGVLSDKSFGDAPFTLSATASSGLPVSFAVASGPATISGNIVTLTGVGLVTITASQEGDCPVLI